MLRTFCFQAGSQFRENWLELATLARSVQFLPLFLVSFCFGLSTFVRLSHFFTRYSLRFSVLTLAKLTTFVFSFNANASRNN